MRSIRVLVAPSGFKESLDADQVAHHIAVGVRRAAPDARVTTTPLVDGGEGTTQTLVRATRGTLYPVTVTGPVGGSVEAHVGLLGGSGPRTAVVEMAAAAGLRLVPRDQRDPLRTTTYGVGQLIVAALILAWNGSWSAAAIPARMTAEPGWRRLSAPRCWMRRATRSAGVEPPCCTSTASTVQASTPGWPMSRSTSR
jgi:hypothetical protein